MGKWSSVLRWVASPVVHPQRTLVGAGRAVKTATIGAGVGYLGWEALVNDKPMLQTAGDLVVGEEANQALRDTVSSTADTVSSVVGGAKDAINGVTDAVNGVNNATSTWGGVGEFMRNLTGGNGMNMFGNFFSNIFNGNVGGMSLLGLVASALLIFGRFGWLGKIAGALLGMMLIGSNSRVQQQQQTQQRKEQQQAPEDKPQEVKPVEEPQRPVIKR